MRPIEEIERDKHECLLQMAMTPLTNKEAWHDLMERASIIKKELSRAKKEAERAK